MRETAAVVLSPCDRLKFRRPRPVLIQGLGPDAAGVPGRCDICRSPAPLRTGAETLVLHGTADTVADPCNANGRWPFTSQARSPTCSLTPATCSFAAAGPVSRRRRRLLGGGALLSGALGWQRPVRDSPTKEKTWLIVGFPRAGSTPHGSS